MTVEHEPAFNLCGSDLTDRGTWEHLGNLLGVLNALPGSDAELVTHVRDRFNTFMEDEPALALECLGRLSTQDDTRARQAAGCIALEDLVAVPPILPCVETARVVATVIEL